MIKSDGTFMVWSDDGGHKVKPQNYAAQPPTGVRSRTCTINAVIPVSLLFECVSPRMMRAACPSASP